MNVYKDEGPISKDFINDFELSLGVELPASYKLLLAKHNGLVPEADYFKYGIGGEEEESNVVFESFGKPEDDAKSIERVQGTFDIYGSNGIVAFGHCANGDYICFDYRHGLSELEPCIVLMRHDEFVENEYGEQKMLIINVANNFDDFIGMLYILKDDD